MYVDAMLLLVGKIWAYGGTTIHLLPTSRSYFIFISDITTHSLCFFSSARSRTYFGATFDQDQTIKKKDTPPPPQTHILSMG